MVVIDSTMLMLLIRPDVAVPGAIPHAKERIQGLVQELDNAKVRIIIPTPALSEALVRAGAAATQQIIEYLSKASVFRIEPFDTKAAVELAAMTRGAIDSGNKRGRSAATWAKVKFDRQIIAIAKVCGATTIYSDDRDLRSFASRAHIKVIGLADLKLPEKSRQHELPFVPGAPGPEGGGC